MEVRRLPDTSRGVWQRDLAGLVFPSSSDPEAWGAFDRASIELAEKHLTPEISESLDRMRTEQGVLVIENLPVDSPLIGPPSDNFRPAGKLPVSEAVHLGIIRQFVHVYGFEEEEEGAIFHQIAPKVGREQTQSNGGVVPFKPHSDDAFLYRAHRPEFLSLFGLLNENSAPTWLFPIERVVEKLPSEVIDQLCRSDFSHAPPTSFSYGATEIETTCHPVIDFGAGRWEVSFNSVRTSGHYREAEEALAIFKQALQEAPHFEAVIAPGTLLIFSNLRHLHGRGAVSGRRWLQRLYSRRDLSDLRRDSGVEAPGLIFSAARLVAGYALV